MGFDGLSFNSHLVLQQGGGLAKKQTGCVLMRQGEGMASREIKLKELKHEDHIALGK
jgi:hypothetical protein